jgi:ABC-type lipoprotein export system ATPase subunit
VADLPICYCYRWEVVLKLTTVTRSYEVGDATVVALNGVSLQIDAGEFVAIVGPSGSGKSTLLQILGLLDRPTSGTVELDGQSIADLSDSERTALRLHSIGFVFQRFHLLRDLTAIENVTLPMEAAGVPLDERFARAADLLTTVGLGERLDFRPARLSGGQRQRVAIARAFANNPKIVFADEPTGELHSEDTAQVVDLFHRFNRQGHTLVLVTHDPDVAAVARRQLEIRDGRVKELVA